MCEKTYNVADFLIRTSMILQLPASVSLSATMRNIFNRLQAARPMQGSLVFLQTSLPRRLIPNSLRSSREVRPNALQEHLPCSRVRQKHSSRSEERRVG